MLFCFWLLSVLVLCLSVGRGDDGYGLDGGVDTGVGVVGWFDLSVG